MVSTASKLAKATAFLIAIAIALVCAGSFSVPIAHAAMPAKPKISSVKSSLPGQITVKVKKTKGAKSYQIAVSTSKKFKGSSTVKKKVKASPKAKKTTATIGNLAFGKKYYVKVRARSNTGKYGKWSAVKRVVTKQSASTSDSPQSPITDSPTSGAVNPGPSPSEPDEPEPIELGDPVYVYVDAGRSQGGTKLYEMYVEREAKAPEAGASYKDGTVVAVLGSGNTSTYAVGSITLLTVAEYGSLSLPKMTYCTSIDLSKADTSALTTMNKMFSGLTSLETLDISGWNTSQVTDMQNMFSGLTSLETLDISGWNTSQVTDMQNMFMGCTSLKSLDLSDWDTGNVQYMSSMFFNCSSLEEVLLSDWNTSNVFGIGNMFAVCPSLASLDLSGWNTKNVKEMNQTFSVALSTLKVGEGWSTDKASAAPATFPTAMKDKSGTQYKRGALIPNGANEYMRA